VVLEPLDLAFELRDAFFFGGPLARFVVVALARAVVGLVAEVREDGLDGLLAGDDARGDLADVLARGDLRGDAVELVGVGVVGAQRGGHRVALVVVVVPLLAGAVLLDVDREVPLGRPRGGVEAPAQLLDGLGHGRHVRAHDDRASALDDPLGDLGGVGGPGRHDVQHLAVEADDRHRGGGPGVDPDHDVVAALREGVELDAVAPDALDLDADVARSFVRDRQVLRPGLHGEDRPREAAVLLGGLALVVEAGLVELAFDLPGPLFHRPVDAPGVPVLGPPAAARRTAAGDLDLGLVGEGADDLADVARGQPGGGLCLLHRLAAVGDVVARGDPRERLGALGARDLHEARPVGESAQEVDQGVLVLGEFVDVVGGDDGRLFVADEPVELPPGDHVAVDVLAVERHQGVGDVAAHVAALDVHPEHHVVECARPRAHVLAYARRHYKCGARGVTPRPVQSSSASEASSASSWMRSLAPSVMR